MSCFGKAETAPERQTIVVFGAGGQTGWHFVKHALDAGYHVRACVRNTEALAKKLGAQANDSHLELFPCDITNAGQVDKAITKGANAVVSFIGHSRDSRPGMCPAFMRQVLESSRKIKCDRVIYQSGGAVPAPGKTFADFSIGMKIFRMVLIRALGIVNMVRDNDAVMEVLHKEADDIRWTVTRPGMIVEKPSQGTVTPHPTKMLLSKAVTFTDLAKCTLELVKSGEYVHEAPYVNYY